MVSDIGGILVKFGWDEQILSNQDTNLQLDFSDALSTEEINGGIKKNVRRFYHYSTKIISIHFHYPSVIILDSPYSIYLQIAK